MINFSEKSLAIIAKPIQTMTPQDASLLINDLKKSVEPLLGDADKVASFMTNAPLFFMDKAVQSYGNPTSVVFLLLEAASLKLSFSKTLKHFYLVPRYNSKSQKYEIQLQISYIGIAELMHRTGNIKDISLKIIYSGDVFSHKTVDNVEIINYERKYVHSTDDKITHAYCIIRMLNGGVYAQTMSIAEIEAIRLISPSQKKGLSDIWKSFYSDMCKKTVFLKARKLVPNCVEYKDFAIFRGDIGNPIVDTDYEDLSSNKLLVEETAVADKLNSIQTIAELNEFEKQETRNSVVDSAIQVKKEELLAQEIQNTLESPEIYEPIIKKIEQLINIKDFNRLKSTFIKYGLNRKEFKEHPLANCIKKQVNSLQYTFVIEWFASNPSNNEIEEIPTKYLATFGTEIIKNKDLFEQFTASSNAQKQLNNG